MTKRVIVAAFSVVLLLLVSCGSPSSQPSMPASGPNAIETTAAQLYAEFDANEVRAADLYEGETLRVTGIVISIGKEIASGAYIVLGSGQGFEVWGVQCLFDSKEEVVPLDEGQKVTVEGKCEGCFVNVLLEHCSVLEIQLTAESSEPSQTENVAPMESLSAMCTVASWDQEYYEYRDDWGDVVVCFEVWNTGNVEIDFYQVYFEAYCHGATYSQRTNGMNVPVGATTTDIVYIHTAGNKATSVAITDWELRRHRLLPLPNTAWRIS